LTDRDRLARVFWLGGMSGVGKTTAARALARRHDLRLYSFDAHQYEHTSRMPP
jgi:shikimate kinase